MSSLRKRSWWRVLKWLTLPLFAGILWYQVSRLHGRPDLAEGLSILFRGEGALMISALLLILTLLNYGLESKKWQLLVRPVWPVSFGGAMKDVCTGILFSILTPARLGEPGGRIIHIDGPGRLAGIAAVLIGSAGQNIVIFALGSMGGVIYLHAFSDAGGTLLTSLSVLCGAIIVIALTLYLNIEKFIPLARKLPWPRRWKPYLIRFRALKDYSMWDLLQVVAISLIRVLVWTAQYLLILSLLHPDFDRLMGIPVAWTVFLLQTGLPLPPVSGLVARSSIAIVMWKSLGIDEWNALASSFVIYFYNLIIPSVLGLFVLLFNRKSLNENV